MPQRMLEDKIWDSSKLEKLDPKHRPEYAWIYPLAQHNGCFECIPRSVWAQCYAQIRPGWTVDDVVKLLDDLEAAKLLMRYKRGTKIIGYWVDSDKGSRLPKLKERTAKRYKEGPEPTPEELSQFLGIGIPEVLKRFDGIFRSCSPEYTSELRRNYVAPPESVRTGMGIGNGRGEGGGLGVGVGKDEDEGLGQGNAIQPSVTVPIPLATTSTLSNQKPQSESQSDTNSTPITHTPSSKEKIKPKALTKHEPEVQMLVEAFRNNLNANPAFHPESLHPNWNGYWALDIIALLEEYSFDAALALIQYSQASRLSKYIVRTAMLRQYAAELAEKFKIPTREQERGGMKVPGPPPTPRPAFKPGEEFDEPEVEVDVFNIADGDETPTEQKKVEFRLLEDDGLEK